MSEPLAAPVTTVVPVIPVAENNFSTADALAVLKHSVGSELIDSSKIAYYDLNGDGKLTTADALMILQLVVG